MKTTLIWPNFDGKEATVCEKYSRALVTSESQALYPQQLWELTVIVVALARIPQTNYV